MIKYNQINTCLFLVPDKKLCGSPAWLSSPVKKRKTGNIWYDRNSDENLTNIDKLWYSGQPDGQDYQNCSTYHADSGM